MSDIYRRYRFRAQTSAAGILSNAGISPPPEWSALRRRYESFIGTGDPALDRLTSEEVPPANCGLGSLS
jgi:hypothetical protein